MRLWLASICHDIIMIACSDLKIYFVFPFIITLRQISFFSFFVQIFVVKQSKNEFSFYLIFDEAKNGLSHVIAKPFSSSYQVVFDK